MLSRTAADLYWMSRYLERAENLARMLEVSYSLSLMPQAGRTDGRAELAMSLLAAGTLDDYNQRHDTLDTARMLHFFAFDETNPGSIYCCLQAARTNAHAVRGRITADMWENINATWLEMRKIASNGLARYGMSQFCDWVKERSHLFRGATSGTIMRNDAYCFIRLGTFLERADNTLRLLDVRYEMFGEASDEVSDHSARATISGAPCCAPCHRSRPSTRSTATPPAPGKSRNCCCCAPMYRARSHTGRASQRMAAELNARLRYTDIDEILEAGLHPWLTDFIECIRQLGQTVHNSLPGGRMKLAIYHDTRYTYANPVSASIQFLRLTPKSTERQQILEWRVQMPRQVRSQIDPYGNVLHVLTLEEPHSALALSAYGQVEIDPSLEVEHDSQSPLPFLRTSRLTQANETLIDFAVQRCGHRRDRAALIKLMEGLADCPCVSRLRPQPGNSGPIRIRLPVHRG